MGLDALGGRTQWSWAVMCDAHVGKVVSVTELSMRLRPQLSPCGSTGTVMNSTVPVQIINTLKCVV